MLKVYGFSTQNNGCAKFRIWQPLDALARQGLIEMKREPDVPGGISPEKADEIFRWADVVVAQPSTEPLAATMLVAARDVHDKKLVVDLDDDFWAVHPLNVGVVNGALTYVHSVFTGKFDDFWAVEPITEEQAQSDEYQRRYDGVVSRVNGKPAFIRQKRADGALSCEFILSHADAITTTNQPLADKFTKRLGARSHVLPNCLDLSEWRRMPSCLYDTVWLGWCGSVSHYPDLEPLMTVLDKLMARYPQLHVQIMGSSFDYLFPFKDKAGKLPIRGYDGGDLGPLVAAEFEDTVERWPGRMQFDRPVPIQQYVSWMKTNWKADIGIAPLLDNAFNRAKSELKWLEYTVLGSATIASKVGPYQRAIAHDVTGKLCGSTPAWLAGLEELIEAPDKRASLQATALEVLHDRYDQDKEAKKWLAVYRGL